MISSLPLRKIQGLQPAPSGDVWPFSIPSVRSILEDGLIFAPITVIVGENGAGKSVLLESVAEAFGFPLEGGSLAEQRESIEGESALGTTCSWFAELHEPETVSFFGQRRRIRFRIF